MVQRHTRPLYPPNKDGGILHFTLFSFVHLLENRYFCSKIHKNKSYPMREIGFRKGKFIIK